MLEDLSDFDYSEFNRQKRVYLGQEQERDDGSLQGDPFEFDVFDEINKINDGL